MTEYRIDTYKKFMDKYGDVKIPNVGWCILHYGFPNEENFWIWREVCRFKTNEYTHIGPLFLDICFAHPSKSAPGMVAFTQNEEKGKADIQLRVKPGKYFKLLYPNISEDEIRKLAEDFNLKHGKPQKLQWAHTEDEIEWVYTHGHGFNSCMHKDLDAFSSPFHPVRMYGKSEDTAVAYVLNNNRVVARTVCNLKEKEWIRIYGDTSCIEHLLQQEEYNEGDLSGCCFPLIEYNNGIVMPYIDGGSTFNTYGNYLKIIEYGAYEANSECGLVSLQGLTVCADCEERYPEDEIQYSGYHEQPICNNCASQQYYYAKTVHGEQLIHEACVAHCEDGGTYFLAEDAAELGYTYCDQSDTWFLDENVVELANGETCHIDNCEVFEEESYLKDDFIEDYKGNIVPKELCITLISSDRGTIYILESDLSEAHERCYVALRSGILYYLSTDTDFEDINNFEIGSLMSITELAEYAKNKINLHAFVRKALNYRDIPTHNLVILLREVLEILEQEQVKEKNIIAIIQEAA